MLAALNYSEMLVGLLGGLAVFLTGMVMMTNALKKLAGKRLRSFLQGMTGNRFTSILTGTGLTALTQSSSVTTVLLVGAVSASLMSVEQSVAVILGANIGSTITAQIIAFKVTNLAPVLVGFGLILSFMKSRQWHYTGQVLQGLGFVFFGMNLMALSTSPMRSDDSFLVVLNYLENPFYALVFATLFTAVVQSSAATTGLLMVMLSQGLISLESSIIMAFGANIGTCVTALLASIAKPRVALQVAVIHILFNVIGVLIWLPLIDVFVFWTMELSPSYPDLAESVRFTKEAPRQLANAHTLFNVINCVIFLPLTGALALLVKKVVPDRGADESLVQFLHPIYLGETSVALSKVRSEILHMMGFVEDALEDGRFLALAKDADIDEWRKELQKTDELYEESIRYLREVSQGDLSEEEGQELECLMRVASVLNNQIDLLIVNWCFLAKMKLKKSLELSEDSEIRLEEIYHANVMLYTLLRESLNEGRKVSKSFAKEKKRAKSLLLDFDEHLLQRFRSSSPNRVELYHLQTELASTFSRFLDLTCRAEKVQRQSLKD